MQCTIATDEQSSTFIRNAANPILALQNPTSVGRSQTLSPTCVRIGTGAIGDGQVLASPLCTPCLGHRMRPHTVCCRRPFIREKRVRMSGPSAARAECSIPFVSRSSLSVCGDITQALMCLVELTCSTYSWRASRRLARLAGNASTARGHHAGDPPPCCAGSSLL